MEMLVKPLVEYFNASRVELTKVAWPNRRTLVRLTFTVIVFSLVFAAILGGLDVLFSGLVQKVIAK
jgi:preprotein translocase SecE subunit